MNVSDVARRVRDSAGDVAVLQFSNDTLTDWINDGIREVIVENSLCQAKATTVTVVGQTEYTLPSDIFKLHSVWVDGFKLEVLTLEQWEERNAGEPGADAGNSSPFLCYIYAGVLNLWPSPDTEKTLVINYTKLPASISYTEGAWVPTTLGIPEPYHNRVVTYCLAQVAMQDEDYDKYNLLMEQFRTGVRDLSHSKESDDLYPFISVSSRDMGNDWRDIYY